MKRSLKGSEGRILVLETMVDVKARTIDQVQERQIAHGILLASTDAAINAIKDVQRQADTRHKEISVKLDAIPALVYRASTGSPHLHRPHRNSSCSEDSQE